MEASQTPCDWQHGGFVGLGAYLDRSTIWQVIAIAVIMEYFVLPPRLAPAFSVSKDAVQLVHPAGQLIGWQLPFMKGE